MENTGIKEKLKKCGKDVIIYDLAKIAKPEVVEVGDNTKIDDFVFINGGKKTKIGRYVHIASFTSIIGGGELVVGDYVAIAAGTRIITGTDQYESGKRMSAALPLEQRDVLIGKVVVKKDAFLGTNVIVYPNVTIGEGAVIGSNSTVTGDIEPWTINVGNPCRVVKRRPAVTVEDI
jgi:acetyltransferase-like isoleucine patch superfamily enzyme